MKNDIHPKTHPVVFVDTSCGEEFISTSTLTSDSKRDIDGVEHYVINVEISSASHPFYTGKQILVDTARRVEKFEERMKKSQVLGSKKKSKKEEKVEEVKDEAEEKEIEETPVIEEVVEEIPAVEEVVEETPEVIVETEEKEETDEN